MKSNGKSKIIQNEETQLDLDKGVLARIANDSSDYWEYAGKVMPRIIAPKSGNDIYGNSVRKTVQKIAEDLCQLIWETAGDTPSASQKYLAAIEHTLGRPAYNKLKEMVSKPQLRNISDREQLIVLCFAMVELGATVEECDKIINSATSEKIHHRPLYQLDAREGYFRFILYWNEKHQDAQITYRTVCDELYPEFQEKLIEGISGKLTELENLMEANHVDEELFERLKTVKNQPTDTNNLAGISAALEAINKKINHGETDVTGNRPISTTAMQHDTAAWQSDVENCITECGDNFDAANDRYTGLAITFIGEKDWTAASIIIQALNDVDRMKENWELYGISSYKSELQKGEIDVSGKKLGSRLSRVMMENLKNNENNTSLTRMFNPRLRLEEIERGFVVPLPDSVIAGEPNKSIIETLVKCCGLYNENFTSNMANGVVKTSRRDLLRFAFAAGCKTFEEFHAILSLSGDKSFRLNSKRELLIMMLLQYIKSKRYVEESFSILEAMRYTEQMFILFSVKEFMEKADAADFEDEKKVDKIIDSIKSGLLFPRPDVLSSRSDAFLHLTLSVYAVIEALVFMVNEKEYAEVIENDLFRISFDEKPIQSHIGFLHRKFNSPYDEIDGEIAANKCTWDQDKLNLLQCCFNRMTKTYTQYLDALYPHWQTAEIADKDTKITLELRMMHLCIEEICRYIVVYLKSDCTDFKNEVQVYCDEIDNMVQIYYSL